jgi:hypothetical protein
MNDIVRAVESVHETSNSNTTKIPSDSDSITLVIVYVLHVLGLGEYKYHVEHIWVVMYLI